MKKFTIILASGITLWCSLILAAVDEYNVPSGLETCVAAPANKDIALSDRMNPFYLPADFDGNGTLDYVALITQTSTGKAGFLVCLRSRTGKWTQFRLGAGVSTKLEGDLSDDDLRFDAWMLYEGRLPGITGPMIHLIAKETGSGVFYWRNGRFVWRQLGI